MKNFITLVFSTLFVIALLIYILPALLAALVAVIEFVAVLIFNVVVGLIMAYAVLVFIGWIISVMSSNKEYKF